MVDTTPGLAGRRGPIPAVAVASAVQLGSGGTAAGWDGVG